MTRFAWIAGVCATLLIACASAPRAVPASPKSSVVGTTFEVAPPYHDPEYVLRFRLPGGQWDERHAIAAGADMPDMTAVFTRRSDGVVVEVLFLPSFDRSVSEACGKLHAGFVKRRPGTYQMMYVEPDGMQASFEAVVDERSVSVRVFRLEGMNRSFAAVSVFVPEKRSAKAGAVFEDFKYDLAVVKTGPLTPKAQLAQCLTEKGAVLYSASWCGPCKAQLLRFGEGVSRLTYIQCDDEKGSTKPVCAKVNLMVYPTWIFADGVRVEGNLPLDEIAERAGCPKLPSE